MDAVREIADAVLYEGHLLWPYRRSSIKNQQRWTFGGVYPAAYARASSDRSSVQVECLFEGADAAVDVGVRFLHVVHRQAAEGEALRPVDEVAGRLTWDETTERTVELLDVRASASTAIDVPPGRRLEPVDGGALVRTWERLEGRVEATIERRGEWLHLVRVTVRNDSPRAELDRDSAVRRTFLSAHVVLRARTGELVSATDPPPSLQTATAELRNDGLWPVLVGEDGRRDTMLAAPIILCDYPEIAPESPGDFFDGGEIDGMLVLNILGLTDEEKREMRAGDPRGKEILERTEAMTDDEIRRLHGAIRELRPVGGL